MNANDLIEIVRDYIKDETTPYLWPDTTILRHLRKAERLMCERTHVLIDTSITFEATPGATVFTMAANVLRVYAVRIGTTLDCPSPSTCNIVRFAATEPLGRLRGRSYGIQYQDTTGEPRYFSTELSDRSVTLYPAPDDIYTMDTICAITPNTPVSPTDDSELPDEHQEELANYAAYRCLITNDVDGERVGTAKEFQELWEVYIRDLKREIYRYRTGDMLVMQNWTWHVNGGSSNVNVGT